MENKFKAYQDILHRYECEHRLRVFPSDSTDSKMIDLSGNDYLGLAQLCKESYSDWIKTTDACLTSSASRLLASRQKHYNQLEAELENLYGRPALLFNSGYHANVGTISAIAIPGTLIASDKLIHASIIDGIKMSGTDCVRWNHNDIHHLRKILEKNHDKYERIIVVAESIYSMDGDVASLKELVELKREFPSIIIYLDEAHAFGVRGEKGLGVAEELGLIEDIDILVGTFGKAAASEGAFVTSSPLIINFLINNARSLIFSTALPPLNAAWTLEMVRKIVGMKEERSKLMQLSKEFRNFISRITGASNPSSSQIIPLMTGDASKALKIASVLREKNINALAIRRPTVPPGGERIRFSLNAALSFEELDQIMKTIESVVNATNL